MKILIEIDDHQRRALAEISEQRAGRPRAELIAELIKEALDAYIAENRKPITAYFGTWSDRVANPETFLADQRSEWEGR